MNIQLFKRLYSKEAEYCGFKSRYKPSVRINELSMALEITMSNSVSLEASIFLLREHIK